MDLIINVFLNSLVTLQHILSAMSCLWW